MVSIFTCLPNKDKKPKRNRFSSQVGLFFLCDGCNIAAPSPHATHTPIGLHCPCWEAPMNHRPTLQQPQRRWWGQTHQEVPTRWSLDVQGIKRATCVSLTQRRWKKTSISTTPPCCTHPALGPSSAANHQCARLTLQSVCHNRHHAHCHSSGETCKNKHTHTTCKTKRRRWAFVSAELWNRPRPDLCPGCNVSHHLL